MLIRDSSPATLDLAIPLLRRIVEKTQDTPEGQAIEGVLANALLKAGRYADAEAALRELIARCVAQDNYRRASINAGRLFNLLRQTSRFAEALRLAEEKADYTHHAGLGPWTQLLNEGTRLQALAALGRYEQELYAFLESRRPDVVQTVKAKCTDGKAYNDLATLMQGALKEFAKEFVVSQPGAAAA